VADGIDGSVWRSAAAVVIGDELLAGRVIDDNSPYLATALRAVGVALREIRVIADQEEAIAAAIVDLAPRHDAIFTSGGVGPTHDDVTMAAVARAFGVALVRHPEMIALVQTFYGARASEAAKRMADLPDGAELLRHDRSRVPIVRFQNVLILPGLPSLFRKKVDTVRDWIDGEPFQLRQVLLTADEGAIASILEQVVERHPTVALGSYPEPEAPQHDVKLTLESRAATDVEGALEDLLALLPEGCVVRVE